MRASTYLMFQGKCEKAITAYCAAFEDGQITSMERYTKGEQGPEGSVKLATFTLAGASFMAIDSPVKQDIAFTPAMSIFIECDTDDMARKLTANLSKGGKVLMPLQRYPFADLFSWIEDRYGVNWQFRYREGGDA